MFLTNSINLCPSVEDKCFSNSVLSRKYDDMDSFSGDTTSMISSIPASMTSSITNCNMGLSRMGSISLGTAFVTGKNLLPRPAAGMIALVIGG